MWVTNEKIETSHLDNSGELSRENTQDGKGFTTIGAGFGLFKFQ
jgi:hypothetical protein